MASPVARAVNSSQLRNWTRAGGLEAGLALRTPSPLLVALVQAATTLPMFLLALPAGALADVVDRRKMLLGAQLFGLVAAAILAVLTWLGLTTPYVLLAATFVLGSSAAFSAPVFQAIVPELVDKQALPDAVALNSLGVNISRAIGPALGGVIVALAGTAAVFALNALSVVAVLIVLFTWKRPTTVHSLPPEHFFGALKAGYRYARHSPAMRLVQIRAVGFFVFASALWAMLPLVGRVVLQLDVPATVRSSAAWVGVPSLVRSYSRNYAENSGEYYLGRGDAAVRIRYAGASFCRQCLDRRSRHVRRRPWMDRHDDLPQRGRANRGARLGQGPRSCRLSAHLSGSDDGGQHPLGFNRHPHERDHRADGCCRRAGTSANLGLQLAFAGGFDDGSRHPPTTGQSP